VQPLHPLQSVVAALVDVERVSDRDKAARISDDVAPTLRRRTGSGRLFSASQSAAHRPTPQQLSPAAAAAGWQWLDNVVSVCVKSSSTGSALIILHAVVGQYFHCFLGWDGTYSGRVVVGGPHLETKRERWCLSITNTFSHNSHILYRVRNACYT